MKRPHPMKTHRSIRDMVIFAMLGTLMFASKLAMEALPNIHPVAMLIMVFTVVYRVRALIPLYVFVLLTGLYGGFNLWWLPYLYIWTVLWGITMLLPRRMPRRVAVFVYPMVCGLFGLLYGTLYAPVQAILFGYSFRQMLLWISAGLPFDVLHGAGNLAMGLLVLPLSEVLRRLEKGAAPREERSAATQKKMPFGKEQQGGYPMEKLWFTLENITYDREERRLEGTCIEGTYLGLMAVYLPPEADDTALEEGITVRVLAGPGMTMSLPPQLMRFERFELVES